MTLKDIAREAGVSTSTVSRILNNKGAKIASAETRDRVWAAISKLGYQPNITARRLRTNGSSDESSVPQKYIATIFARDFVTQEDPFFSNISRSIVSEAYRHSYFTKYTLTSGDVSNMDNLNVLSDPELSGVTILGRCDRTVLHILKQKFNNVIYSGLVPIDANFDQIICDGMIAAKTAIEHLIELGHKNIGYIGETANEIRYKSYTETLAAHGIPTTSAYIADELLSCKGGYDGMMRLLRQTDKLTAVFCANDQTAIGAMGAAKESGISVPRDLSIVGIDNIEASSYLTPSLTTVNIPTDEMGKLVAKILIDRISGGHKLSLRIYLPCKLIIRDSTCGPRKL